MNWYKMANDYLDSTVTQQNLADAQVPPHMPSDNQGGIEGLSYESLGLKQTQSQFGIEVEKCGEEPPKSGGCGLPLDEYGEWHDYSIEINGQKYRSYKCKRCKHSLEPFNIKFMKNKKTKKRVKKRSKNLKRVGQSLTVRNINAQLYSKPGDSGSVPGMNPANTPFGRLDLTDTQRMMPYTEVKKNFDQAYDSYVQKGKSKNKVVTVKDKNGKTKKIEVKMLDGIDGVMPTNTERIKGEFSKQTRYNPEEGKNNDGFGAWQHNRDWNKGSYGINTPDNMNADWRTRVMLWDDYIRDRSTNFLTLVKPT